MIGTCASVPRHSPQFRRQPGRPRIRLETTPNRCRHSAVRASPIAGSPDESMNSSGCAPRPGRAVDNRLAVSGEPGAADRAVPERQLTKGRGGRVAPAAREICGCGDGARRGAPGRGDAERRRAGNVLAAGGARPRGVNASSSSSRASPISRSRRFASFCRHRRNRSRRRTGVEEAAPASRRRVEDVRDRVRDGLARQTPRGRSASRTARSRTPRCQCACRAPGHVPVPGSCKRACPGCVRSRSTRGQCRRRAR